MGKKSKSSVVIVYGDTEDFISKYFFNKYGAKGYLLFTFIVFVVGIIILIILN